MARLTKIYCHKISYKNKQIVYPSGLQIPIFNTSGYAIPMNGSKQGNRIKKAKTGIKKQGTISLLF